MKSISNSDFALLTHTLPSILSLALSATHSSDTRTINRIRMLYALLNKLHRLNKYTHNTPPKKN